MFKPLTKANILDIVTIQIDALSSMLSHNGISLEVTESARDWIALHGYDVVYGARPVKRTIQKYVVNDLSKRILAGDVDKDRPIIIDTSGTGLIYKN